ncbi:hypothetical protein QFC24_003283 [Naganishia onofrii]|uniref:Uncharacterized protein n=1 Tax=Naganishia onofrii TaxID=1851511 RepID=A0ACC2XKK5_9TREE|nr:hypothetical protein QFC24_003283 [Naganishia onofrii]
MLAPQNPTEKKPIPAPAAQKTTPPTSTAPPPLPVNQTAADTHARTKNSALAARDEEVMQKLLDMDGGNAGFEFQDGKPAGGQGRETKRNMFRLM